MNGMLPSRSGIYDNAAEFKATTPTFAHYLRSLGYQTCLSGKMHFVGPDQLHGFEERLTTDIYPADFGWTPDWRNPLQRIDWWYHNLTSVTQAGVAEITNQYEFDDEVAYTSKLKLYQYARRLDPRPFCLTVSFTHPHDPYVTRRKYWDRYDHSSIPMPTVPAIPYEKQDAHSKRLFDAFDYTKYTITDEHIRSARHAYLANISYLDDKLGELLDVLDDCDLASNTVVVLCADHGDMLGERGLWYKMGFYEGGMRIPLVISSPAIGHGKVSSPVVAHDILPTLIDLALSGEARSVEDVLVCEIDGRSILELALSAATANNCGGGLEEGKGGVDGEERMVLGEYCAEGSVSPMVMVRKGPYKFVYCDADPPQLFNLASDPHELTNLCEFNSGEAYSAVIQHFMDLVRERWGDMSSFKREVILSQDCRRLVWEANRMGRVITPWDFEPKQNASERFMRNHMDLNVLEYNNRYPKPVTGSSDCEKAEISDAFPVTSETVQAILDQLVVIEK